MIRHLAAAALALFMLAAVPSAHAMTIEKIVSPSGIPAWLVREHSTPLVAMNYAFHGGSAQDGAERPAPPISPPTCSTRAPTISTARLITSASRITPSISASKSAAIICTARCVRSTSTATRPSTCSAWR